MTIVKPLTSHFLIDGLTAVSEAGGVPVKYPKAADYPLSRSDCAEICQKVLHLPDKFRELPDVLPHSRAIRSYFFQKTPLRPALGQKEKGPKALFS